MHHRSCGSASLALLQHSATTSQGCPCSTAASAALHTMRRAILLMLAQATALRPPASSLLANDVRDTAGDEAAWAARVESLAVLPRGFRCGTASLNFKPRELPDSEARMNLGVIALDAPTDLVAGVYTKNRLCGAPVTVGRDILAREKPHIQAILANNKVSNVRPGPGLGVSCAHTVADAAKEALSLEGDVIPASTGVIGWALPVDEMVAAASSLTLQEGSAHKVAEAMMTTDRYAKAARSELPNGASLVGLVKGAGMIEPNMGTMLCFLVTDAAMERSTMQACLERCVKGTLGSVGVDGDESTSDMCVLLSSGQVQEVSEDAFENALGDVLAQLAHHIVRNGEGTNHVLRVCVRGDRDEDSARALGRALVNGPLLKCAVAGDDPNVGRIVGKVGQLLGARGDPDLLDEGSPCVVKLGGETIFEGGFFRLDAAKEERLSNHMKAARLGTDVEGAPACPVHDRCVEIDVDLGGSRDVVSVVLGSDLTHGYVSENADYRS